MEINEKTKTSIKTAESKGKSICSKNKEAKIIKALKLPTEKDYIKFKAEVRKEIERNKQMSEGNNDSQDSNLKAKEKVNNMQDGFLNSCRHDKAIITISLIDGRSEKGLIVAFDNNTIIMSNDEDGQFLIMKTAISVIKPKRKVNYIFNGSSGNSKTPIENRNFSYNNSYGYNNNKPLKENNYNYNCIFDPFEINKPRSYELPGAQNNFPYTSFKKKD